MKRDMSSALVVLSGGQDSATCLMWALDKFSAVHAVTFDYQQKHRREVDAAVHVWSMARQIQHRYPNHLLISHEVVKLGPVLTGSSPLVNDKTTVGHYDGVKALPGGLEATFVPGRNILFLTIAANRAYNLGAGTLVTGVCEEDYGGYPDCRADFIKSMEQALGEGFYSDGQLFPIATPLMNRTKEQTVALALKLPGCRELLAYTHTCYDGCYPPCPKNHASILRAKGFAAAYTADPLIERAIKEGLLPQDYPATGLVEGTVYAEGSIGTIMGDPSQKAWIPKRKSYESNL